MTNEGRTESYLVLGGTGFVGSHILKALAASSSTKIASYSRSLPPAKKDEEKLVQIMVEDGTIEDEVANAWVGGHWFADWLTFCRHKQPSYSTLFLPPHNDDESAYYAVNVLGTQAVINACLRASAFTSDVSSSGAERGCVRALVYTSSSGVVWNGKDISGATEDEVEIPEVGLEAYSATKGIGEKASTPCVRRAGSTNDSERVQVLAANGEKLKTAALRPHAIIGPGDNQAIWRLVENYTSGQYHFQIGSGTNLFSTISVTDVARAHLLAAAALLRDSTSAAVGGQAFFITDGVPVPFYTYPRLVWRELGASDDFWIVKLPRWLCLGLAFFVERWRGLVGGHTILTEFVVKTVTMEQWYRCDKAERLLGYKPTVTLEQAVRETVQWWKEEGAQEHAAQSQSKKLR
ncbi:putative sterol dehydrogenase [Ephemerocybe angulata]|uniref:Putative sterol dehydrogenase n=1 Tax=Ephemerocybe angulata TaxID=980116 RepID=A0A8H6M1K7_9AGAR|nr:putative sterol dehydrogenase [Tulosesus angulatus]